MGIKAQIRALGGEYGDILVAIAQAESNLDPYAENPDGDAGLYQFTQGALKDECPQTNPFSIEESTLCAKKIISNNGLWRWEASKYDRKNYQGWYSRLKDTTEADRQARLCSCILYAQNYIKLPAVKSVSELPANSYPAIGRAVLFRYSNSDHIGIITNWEIGGFKIRESNYHKCQENFRIIKFNDKAIRGFYSN